MSFALAPQIAEVMTTECDNCLIKMKKVLKKIINKVKRQPAEWEKIFANDMTDKELISNIYKQLTQLNIKKTNNLIKNWA